MGRCQRMIFDECPEEGFDFAELETEGIDIDAADTPELRQQVEGSTFVKLGEALERAFEGAT